MNILLDTHILIWALSEPERLPEKVRDDLCDSQNLVYFRAASIWEIAIKASLRRQDFPYDALQVWLLAMETGFTELPITAIHGAGVMDLPMYHRNPFDRLVISQAFALPAYLYTDDGVLPQYSTSLIHRI